MKNKLTLEDIKAKIKPESRAVIMLSDTVILVSLTLINGYVVTGQSACLDIDNFDEDIGVEIATNNAIGKIWELEGYLLKEALHRQSNDE